MSLYALVDCNNFFASCERVFNPRLEGKPVVVLSNNDGCIVARSNEAKALQIPMGAPYFQWKEFLEKHKVQVFSSNFSLYGDMSGRVMQVLHDSCLSVEIYSIDEAFLDVSAVPNAEGFARELRQKIKQWTGIPVSIGIAGTKTLAKIANTIAKKQAEHGGVLFFHDDMAVDAHLEKFHIEDIWGVGRGNGPKLRSLGIQTALDLKQADERKLRALLHRAGTALIQELNNISVHSFHEEREAQKSIISSRSFGRKVETVEELKEAVALYTTRAAKKLRASGQCVTYVSVYICASRFQEVGRYANTVGVELLPTNDTLRLVERATALVEKIYKPGISYRKAGVHFFGLVSEKDVQIDLFGHGRNAKREQLMRTMDGLNARFGDGTIATAAEGVQYAWRMKKERSSPRYTSEWGKLLRVR